MFKKLRERKLKKYLMFIDIIASQLGKKLSYDKKMRMYNIAMNKIKSKKGNK